MDKEKFIKAITPKNTEEVKPGLFIQEKHGKFGEKKYKQIYPSAWNGKIIWKNFILGGPGFWKTTFAFVLLILIVVSYHHDTSSLQEFNYKVTTYKLSWCAGIPYDQLGETYEGEQTYSENIFGYG